jgi:AcrR family transcriptional regulator
MSSTTTTARPATRAEQARHTKSGILTAALRLFAVHGYEATSLQDIADEMSITKAAVYYYFPSKVKILQAVCRPVSEAIIAVLETTSSLPTRRQRIDALADGFVELLLTQPGVLSLMASDATLPEGVDGVSQLNDLIERVVNVIYGANATLDQRLAVFSVAKLGDAIAAVGDLSVDEIRPVLLRTVKRLVPQR